MKELPIHIQLNPESDKCLYEQIYEFVRDEIRAGNLLQNEKLPSSRYLAEYLQVSRTTVDMAYGQLVSEGYLEARPQKGYFVCAIEELYDIQAKTGDSPKQKQNVDSQQSFRYDFSPNKIDMSLFPYATWKKITKNILVDAKSSMFALGEPQGDLELRTTIGRYLHASRGVNCKPEQIIIGAGNDYLLLLLEKILGRHVPVAMENPSYKRAYRIFQSFAYPIALLPMDESGIQMEKLKESKAKIAYVMPAHQYPTGIVMPIGRRMELLKWASEEEDRYIIEDDYDSEFRYRGKPIPSLQASDKYGKVVYIGTFSKAIAPAIRISYMVLPERLLERYHQNCACYSSTVSRIDQTILNEFIKDGYFERYLNKMRKHYRGKHELMLNELKAFEKDFILSGEDAGLHILLTDKNGRSEQELWESAYAAGVKVYQMEEAYLEKDGLTAREAEEKKGIAAQRGATMILGYASLSQKEIVEGLTLLQKIWIKA